MLAYLIIDLSLVVQAYFYQAFFKIIGFDNISFSLSFEHQLHVLYSPFSIWVCVGLSIRSVWSRTEQNRKNRKSTFGFFTDWTGPNQNNLVRFGSFIKNRIFLEKIWNNSSASRNTGFSTIILNIKSKHNLQATVAAIEFYKF